MTPEPLCLILLPGLDGTAAPRADFTRELGPRIAAQILDYPVDRPMGYAALEAWVRDRLPRSRPYVLMGDSFSGPIAIRVAASPPPGLRGLILCGSFATSPRPALKAARHLVALVPIGRMPRFMRATLMWGRGTANTARPREEGALSLVDGRVLRKRLREVLAIDVSQAMARVALPTLILYATRDRIVSKSATRRLIDLAPRARTVAIEGPHLLLQSRARACAAAVADFVAALR